MNPKWKRRSLIGMGAFSATVGGALAYARHRAPYFFDQYIHEMGRTILPASQIPDPRSWPDRGFHSAWLGHSTVLLKLEGFTILTDPIFSDRAGLNLLFFTAGVKR